MLIISRKAGTNNECSFTIGDDIKVTVLDISRSSRSVSIGIEAPRKIKILRDDAIKRKDHSGSVEDWLL